jgi:hypothetical protein
MDFIPYSLVSSPSSSQLIKNKKYKYPVKSINDFIQKILKKEVTGILNKTLS